LRKTIIKCTNNILTPLVTLMSILSKLFKPKKEISKQYILQELIIVSSNNLVTKNNFKDEVCAKMLIDGVEGGIRYIAVSEFQKELVRIIEKSAKVKDYTFSYSNWSNERGLKSNTLKIVFDSMIIDSRLEQFYLTYSNAKSKNLDESQIFSLMFGFSDYIKNLLKY
jgi:hypothetical protein